MERWTPPRIFSLKSVPPIFIHLEAWRLGLAPFPVLVFTSASPTFGCISLTASAPKNESGFLRVAPHSFFSFFLPSCSELDAAELQVVIPHFWPDGPKPPPSPPPPSLSRFFQYPDRLLVPSRCATCLKNPLLFPIKLFAHVRL